jgi:hypothetical protein
MLSDLVVVGAVWLFFGWPVALAFVLGMIYLHADLKLKGAL